MLTTFFCSSQKLMQLFCYCQKERGAGSAFVSLISGACSYLRSVFIKKRAPPSLQKNKSALLGTRSKYFGTSVKVCVHSNYFIIFPGVTSFINSGWKNLLPQVMNPDSLQKTSALVTMPQFKAKMKTPMTKELSKVSNFLLRDMQCNFFLW